MSEFEEWHRAAVEHLNNQKYKYTVEFQFKAEMEK